METIKYVGTATRRVITEREWEQAGVTGQEDVFWDRSNGYTVDASKLSQAARDAIKPDPFFVWSNREEKVEQEVTVDVDLAKEYEAQAKANTTSPDGTGLDEPTKDESPAEQAEAEAKKSGK